MTIHSPKHNFKSGGNINPSRFVTLTGNHTVSESNSTEQPIGVSQREVKKFDSTLAAASGDAIAVYGSGQECLLECGSAISANELLAPDADGKGIPAGSGDYGARALEGGATGDLIRVVVEPGQTA